MNLKHKLILGNDVTELQLWWQQWLQWFIACGTVCRSTDCYVETMLVFSSDARRFASLLRLTSPSVDHGRADCDDAVRCVCLTHIILSLFSLTHDILTTNSPNTSLENSESPRMVYWSGHLITNTVYNDSLVKDEKYYYQNF